MSERNSDDLPGVSSYFGEKSELTPRSETTADAARSDGSFDARADSVADEPGSAVSSAEDPSEPPRARASTGRPRYSIGGELGRGGMGRVHAAFDPLLGREVALKQARDDAPAAEARLLAEARITARLDHPGIVQVLDAGHDASGRPYYAMRVVRGQSLADVVASAAPGRERLTLLRPLLAAIEAVAHAHARGIVHRDLSPTNVRIDAHGVVLVMDWGLAASVEDAARGGTTCGTAGYRAPELERGLASGPAADVFSLGALVHFALTGRPPSTIALPGWVPAELRSIVARALATDAAARYPDASALEDDVAAFLDGRPVSAHVDRLRDKLARRVRKSPLAAAWVTGAALVVGIVVAALAVRATEAERHAEEERAVAQRALIELLVSRAEEALLRDDHTAAEDHARRALALGPSPEARGVLAAFAALEDVAGVHSSEGGCPTLDVAGDVRACLDGATLRLDGPTPRSVTIERGRVAAARILAGPVLAVAVDTGAPHHELHLYSGTPALQDRLHHLGAGAPLLDAGGGAVPRWLTIALPARVDVVPSDGEAHTFTPCEAGALVRALAVSPEPTTDGGARVFVACSDDRLALIEGDAVTSRRFAREVELALRGTTVAAWLDAERVVLGTVEGRIGLVDPRTGHVSQSTDVPVGPVRRIAIATDHEHALVAGELGVALWRIREGAWLAVEPGRGVDVRADGGRLLSFGTGSIREWPLKASAPIHRHTSPAGLSAIAIAPTGLVALGAGNGVITLVEPATGALATLPGTRRAVKSLTFSRDGRVLVAGSASDRGLEVFDVATRAPIPGPWSDVGTVRRVALLGDELHAFRFGANVDVFSLATKQRLDRAAPGLRLALDVAAPRTGAFVAALGDDGQLVRIDASGPRRLATVTEPRAVAVSNDGAKLVTASERGLELRDPGTGDVVRVISTEGATIEELALSPTGDQLAVGRRDGAVELFTIDGALILRVRGHRQRVAGLAFSDDGRFLATASWDGVARWLQIDP
ncbi:serine/threonine-protein kinase [Myxococcota bacterium]|nr:serine/threonine-protein kinase [Myxococcota bacterium]